MLAILLWKRSISRAQKPLSLENVSSGIRQWPIERQHLNRASAYRMNLKEWRTNPWNAQHERNKNQSADEVGEILDKPTKMLLCVREHRQNTKCSHFKPQLTWLYHYGPSQISLAFWWLDSCAPFRLGRRCWQTIWSAWRTIEILYLHCCAWSAGQLSPCLPVCFSRRTSHWCDRMFAVSQATAPECTSKFRRIANWWCIWRRILPPNRIAEWHMQLSSPPRESTHRTDSCRQRIHEKERERTGEKQSQQPIIAIGNWEFIDETHNWENWWLFFVL